MSDAALEMGRPTRALVSEREQVHHAARLVLLSGLTMIVAVLGLFISVDRADVRSPDVPAASDVVVGLVVVPPLLLVGVLLLAYLPRNPIGWIFCVATLGFALSGVASWYATYSHFVHALPGGELVGWVGEWAWAAIMLIPGVALLLFPDGRLPSRRWRPWLWCGFAATVMIALEGALGPGEDLAFQGNPFWSDATARDLSEKAGPGWLLLFPAAIAGFGAVVVRRRAAHGEEREQLRLLQRGTLFVILGFVSCLVASFLAPAAKDLAASAAIVSLGTLAVIMGVAILRHRMYGLDVYVDRALVLSGTAILLGGLYVVAVVGAGRLLGQDADLGVALPATVLVAIAFQPVRERLQLSVKRLLHGQRDEPYAAISTLGRRLSDAMAPSEVLPVIVDTIADALRLPYVAVELADRPGEPAAMHGTPAAGVALRLPLDHAGQRVGTLLVGARAHGEALDEADRRLLEDFARRASAAASAVALSVDVQRSRERLVTAREEERRRLRGDLHDGLGPTLAGAVLTIDAARRVLATDGEAAEVLLDRAAASVEGAVADVRRVVYALRPPALDQLGLVGALEQQATTLSIGDPQLTCLIRATDPVPVLPAAVEVAAFRIAQEALTNVVRHARASRAEVVISVGATLELEIRDDGQGMPKNHHLGVGITSMRERAVELGGSFAITTPTGGGTVIRVELPLPT